MKKAEQMYPNLKIESSEIREGSSVGRGAFGEVVKASRPIYNQDPRFNGHPIETLPIAIKSTKDDSQNGESTYIREIDLLSRFKHSNIVSLMGYYEQSGRIALVYHYAPNKSHDYYIQGGGGADSRFTWAQRLKICIGVARGLEYLHSGAGVQKIKTTVHRDIKSANILLDQNWEAIIGDFGLSTFALQDGQLSDVEVSVAGTPGYQDPHYLKSEDLSEKVDVYSYGVLLYEVLSGKIATVKKRPPSSIYGSYPDPEYESLLPQLRKQLLSKRDVLDREGKYINLLLTLTRIADKCLEDDRYKRPEMIHIVEELEKLLKDQIRISNLRVSFLEIEKATENFKDSNMITWGESARLYKGEIFTTHGSKTVAIKRLNGGVKQEEVNFLIEILTLSDYKHPNIIDLQGFHCDENTKIVIYEFAFHLSLDKYLSNTSNKCCFTWKQFLKICHGAAQGLEFIHTFKPGDGIVHGDVKASNILITRDGEAKISNFGLTKRTHKNKCKFLTSSGTGTLGYCDPKYMETGLLTKESDVYAFGLVLFEVWGKKLVLENDCYYGEQVHERKNRGNMKPVNKNEQINSESLSRFLAIARQCVQENPEDRPKMGLVVQELGKALSYADSNAAKHSVEMSATV